jgi:hypothetical protein
MKREYGIWRNAHWNNWNNRNEKKVYEEPFNGITGITKMKKREYGETLNAITEITEMKKENMEKRSMQ